MHPEQASTLDTLTGTIDHLQFVHDVINRTHLSDSIRVELHQQIASIQSRLADPQLYLAVIGEFSSGKSTLINAFLRDELLKTSALVTTAAATCLTQAESISIEVQLQGDCPRTIAMQPGSRLITIPALGILDVDQRQLIHLVTADETIAPQVAAVTIRHPARFLSHHITIIDTPGTNATTAEHAAITRKVVEQQADAAIVIIPATVPLSQSLSSFLTESLRPYLHRCIFVVTRLDQIRESEQAALLTDLRSRLSQQLGIEPSLYPCAAQVLLDHLSGVEIPTKLQHWIREFEQLEATILHRLRQERSLNIAERILRLLTRLLTQLEQSLQSQCNAYEQRYSAIQQEIIPDLTAFTIQQQSHGQKQIRSAISRCISRLNQSIEQHRQKVITQVQEKLFQTIDVASLNRFISDDVKAILNGDRGSLFPELRREIATLSQAGAQASLQFDQQFTAAYRKLQALNPDTVSPAPSIANLQFDANKTFSATQLLCADLNDRATGWAVGGAGSGALIGTMILPGAGTLIGGAIGFGLSLIASPSLSERQQQLWNKLRPELDVYFNTLKGQVQTAAETHAQQMMTHLSERINQYMAHYQQTVDRILQEQTHELALLQQQQQQVHTDLQAIQFRRDHLTRQQQRLMNTSLSE